MPQVDPLQPSVSKRHGKGAAWVEIRRGRSKYPRRPILRDRFLIGAGSNCDLQLGGSDVPLVHSIIHIDGDGLRIEALVARPELKVDGRRVRFAPLVDGQVLEIGLFTLAVRLTAGEAGDVVNLPQPGERELTFAERAAQLSASQLADGIELELAALRQDERRQQAGWSALLQAVRTSPGRTDGVDVTMLEGIVSQLEALAGEIALSLQRLGDRERALMEQSRRLQELHDLAAGESSRAEDVETDPRSRLRLSA